jgi:hypothetical protein
MIVDDTAVTFDAAAAAALSKPVVCEWSEVEKMLLRKLIFTFGSASVPSPAPSAAIAAANASDNSVHSLNFCALANTLGTKTCAQVHAFVLHHASPKRAPFITHGSLLAQEAAQLEARLDAAAAAAVGSSAAAVNRRRSPVSDDHVHFVDVHDRMAHARRGRGKKKRRPHGTFTRAALTLRLRQAHRRSLRNLPHAFVPCDHPGVSCAQAPDCPCVRNQTFCEKYCACDSSCNAIVGSTTSACGGGAAQNIVCPNRFLGCARSCRTTSSRCNTRACPCFAANRECDPDLCGNCTVLPHGHPDTATGASAAAGAASAGDNRSPSPPAAAAAAVHERSSSPVPVRHCANQSLQLGARAQLLLAESDIHGWGCFLAAAPPDAAAIAAAGKEAAEALVAVTASAGDSAAAAASNDGGDGGSSKQALSTSLASLAAPLLVDGVRKHSVITEYFGELISQGEADRRGQLYDRANRSYLFNLTSSQVVDAARKGSKVKYANHSVQANCYSKVIQVAADHRIAICAARNIRPGEELCFNYQHEFEHAGEAPQWFKHVHGAGGGGAGAKQSNARAARKATHAAD